MNPTRNTRISTFTTLGVLLAALPTSGQATISEINVSMPGPDHNEFFELVGTPGASLTGLTYVVIGDGTGGNGVIESVTDLSGQAINGSGFFVAAEMTAGFTPDLITPLAFENSDQVTHMLVSGFTGTNGQDLDLNDDGVLDVTPWTGIVDCIAIIGTGGDLVYCASQAGPDASFVAAHVYVCASGAWTVGDFEAADDTPGASNGPCRGFSGSRNGVGCNPTLFTETNQSAIGGTWEVAVDLVTAGAFISLVAVSPTATSGTKLTGVVTGELLCLPPYTTDLAVGAHSLPVPNDLSLVGLRLCAQAVTIGSGSFALTNALDLTL